MVRLVRLGEPPWCGPADEEEFMMSTKFVLSRSVVVVAIAFALGSSAFSANAFAAGGTLKGGRVAVHANAHRSDYIGQGASEWDPWGHWGSYYGPMVHAAP